MARTLEKGPRHADLLARRSEGDAAAKGETVRARQRALRAPRLQRDPFRESVDVEEGRGVHEPFYHSIFRRNPRPMAPRFARRTLRETSARIARRSEQAERFSTVIISRPPRRRRVVAGRRPSCVTTRPCTA